jgi:hypothetical protein
VCSEADLRKNNFCKYFLSFCLFQCEAFGRLLFASRRVWLNRPDGSGTRSDTRGSNCWTVKLHIRTPATCLHVYEAMHVWKGLMSRLDGDPTASIKPGRRISEATPQKSLFWLLVSDFSQVFCIISFSFVCLYITLSFQVLLYLSLFFSVVLTLLEF